MRKILVTLLLLSINLPVLALDYNDVITPKQHAYRLGISETPEKMYVEAEVKSVPKQYVEKDTSIQHSSDELTFADLSLKRMSSEISTELAIDEKNMMSDLSLLWKGAATQSDTINFALYKLANPDEYNFVSTGGGATLEYIKEKKLLALEGE